MDKSILVFGNPYGRKSKIASEMASLADKDGIQAIFLNEYVSGDGKFPVADMQRRLESFSTIIIHAPVYWYSTPALVKSWIDQLFTPGWAFPKHESKLKGKRIAMSLTVGAEMCTYADGQANRFELATYFLPFEQAFRYCGMDWRGVTSCQFPSPAANAVDTAAQQLQKALKLFSEPT